MAKSSLSSDTLKNNKGKRPMEDSPSSKIQKKGKTNHPIPVIKKCLDVDNLLFVTIPCYLCWLVNDI
ncbi:Uncharacterized protein TCM_009715 [Theobroma cacao]|uniref:Uncharacterized protein n=1 Tax=Theobroma cacao TaxID=3641 RepID=A0A061ED01_THECC|nr:Uncharacterized protein TCM_009715 [Theobroma cacao]